MQRPLRYKYFLIITIVIFLLGIIWITQFIYNRELEAVRSEINTIFNEVLVVDLDKRFDEKNTFYYFEQTPNTIINNISVTTEDTTINTTISDPNDRFYNKKMQFKVLQTLLRSSKPIIAESLDSLFNDYLKNNNINAIISTTYKDKAKQTIDTTLPDSLFLRKALATDEILLGINKEMSIQSYAQLSLLDILSRDKKRLLLMYLFWTLFISLIVLLFLYFKYRSKKKINNIISNDKAVEYQYQITKSTFFQPEKNRLIHNDKPIVMIAQSCLLLKLLLDSPEHFASHKDIYQLLWNKDSPYGLDTLPRAITRLRKYLKPIPEVKIVSIRKQGYELVIDRPGKDKEDDQEQKKAVPSE